MCIHCSIDHTSLIMNKASEQRKTETKRRRRRKQQPRKALRILYAPQSLVFLMKSNATCSVLTNSSSNPILLLVTIIARHFFFFLTLCKYALTFWCVFIFINTITFGCKHSCDTISFSTSNEFLQNCCDCFFFLLFT